MKNRNDDKKYILNQYRKDEIKRLFNKLEEIQNRQPKNNQIIIKRMFGETNSSLSHIPRNHNEQRLYQIRKQNERLVQKLSTTKMTVVSHRLPLQQSRTSRKFRLRDTLRQKQIDNENKRLFRAINRASTDFLSSRKNSTSSVQKFNKI